MRARPGGCGLCVREFKPDTFNSRLHVNIYDNAKTQFTLPTAIITPPGTNTGSTRANSDLVFNYQASPFAFWITRRTSPNAAPIFDTRISSLPKTPLPPVTSDNSTALDGFPLVFEDSYLQVSRMTISATDGTANLVQLTSALPRDTNIYGLGEVIASSGIRRDVANKGSIQTNWARDVADPVDANEYVPGLLQLWLLLT
jgi:alpha-glucosidase